MTLWSHCLQRDQAQTSDATNVSGDGIPLLGEGGVAAPPKKWREAPLVGADGVVSSNHRLFGSWTNHPVRSSKGGFAAFLLMSRPPLLCQGGESPEHEISVMPK